MSQPCKACEQTSCVCQFASQYDMTRARGRITSAAEAQQPATLEQLYGQQAAITQGKQYGRVEPAPHPKAKGLAERLARLLVHRQTLETYSQHRMEDRDRHAVSDAANDLRELECEIRCVEEMIELVGGSVK